MPLVTRTAKGSPLTTAEMDGNLTFLKARSRPYASVAAMQADTDLQVGDLAQTVGYYAAGDGGGATYEIVSADTVIGYDEPNYQAYNRLPGAQTTLSGWERSGIAAYGSGSSDNALLAPDGTVSADFIAETATTGPHYVQYRWTNTTASFPGPQEFFVYVAKPSFAPNARPYFGISAHVGNPASGSYDPLNYPENLASARVDLTTLQVTYTSYGANLSKVSTHVTDLGTGWVLLKLRFTPPSNLSGFLLTGMAASTLPAPGPFTGDATKGAYLWGWGIRPLITPGITLSNTLQAKPLLGNTVRLSQFAATSGADNNALLRALGYFGTSPGTLIIDAPTVFLQPASLSTLTIPSNVTLRFEGGGSLAGVTSMAINSQLIADNRAILPKTTAVTFSSRQSSIKPNWFGL